ncbi:MAG: hypothetical protein JO353_08380 [Phycisphaerae bacterium]|nr:hypothetical protein [Phycisphaerae bacterium]
MTEPPTGGEKVPSSSPTTADADAALKSSAMDKRSPVPMAPGKRKPTEAARLRAANLKARKLDAIATRRAAAANMGKAEFIAEIVKGTYKPITAAEIAAEPNPE